VHRLQSVDKKILLDLDLSLTFSDFTHDSDSVKEYDYTITSFTYIPGIVIHVGYGSLYEKIKWEGDEYHSSDNFLETKRGFFFKASFLWRL